MIWTQEYQKLVLCDRPGEGSSEKNCCWWLYTMELQLDEYTLSQTKVLVVRMPLVSVTRILRTWSKVFVVS